MLLLLLWQVATAVLSVAKKAKAKQKRLLSVAGAEEKKGEAGDKGNPSGGSGGGASARSDAMEVVSALRGFGGGCKI